jgi:hypothetical protein
MSEDVYNGRQKLQTESMFFMSSDCITNYVKSLKVKNIEGNDRISQPFLIDGIDHFINALATFQ